MRSPITVVRIVVAVSGLASAAGCSRGLEEVGSAEPSASGPAQRGLTVEPALGSGFSRDAWITTKAKIALVTRSQVPAMNVHVDTVDGRVTLYGKVVSDQQRQLADDAVRGISGVRQIRNLLQIVPSTVVASVDLSDDRIKEDVRQAMKEDPVLSGSEIRVKAVNGGAVLLTGKAVSLAAHWEAVACASAVPGVRNVASEIRVATDEGGGTELSQGASDATEGIRDAWTTADVRLRLLADSEVPALDIGVDTTHGVVRLIGIVADDAAKSAAVADARKVATVVSVQDDIDVRPESHPVVVLSDDAIKLNVEAALSDSVDLAHLQVTVKDGRVHLSGTVTSRWDRLRAALKAREATGVRAVDDDLQVAATRG